MLSFVRCVFVVWALLGTQCIVRCWTFNGQSLATRAGIVRSSSSGAGSGMRRIVNGEPASEYQFPWFVSIRSHLAAGELGSICGASLIADDWLLTAAHCTHGFAWHALGFGATHIDRPRIAMRVEAGPAIVEHPLYNADNLNNDIAVIRLPGRVRVSAHVQFIRLPSLRQAAGGAFHTQMARVCGFGRVSDESIAMSSVLRWVDKRIISNGQCTQAYGPAIVLRSTVCTIGWDTNEQSTCNGDSGGPLVIDEGGVWTQIGIVSFVSNRGCGAGYPAGYVRTAAYLPWISAQTGIGMREY